MLGKLLFGGLGQNPFNPALVGRAVLQAAFPVAMTTWLPPFAAGRFAGLPRLAADAAVHDAGLRRRRRRRRRSSAWKFGHQPTGAADLALGFVGGSTGETSAVLILLGGAYLVGAQHDELAHPGGDLRQRRGGLRRPAPASTRRATPGPPSTSSPAA